MMRRLLFVGALLAPAQTSAETTEVPKYLELLKPNVVSIEAEIASEDSEVANVYSHGFGLIIGSRGKDLYALTTLHGLYGGSPEEGRIVSVKSLRLFNSERLYPCRPLEWIDEHRDLAAVVITGGAEYKWRRECLDPELSRGQSLWYLGRDGAWEGDVSPGVLSEILPLQDQLSIEGMSVDVGSSGGAVVSQSGLSGMILRSTGLDLVRATSVTGMQQFAEQYHLPWQLRSKPGPPWLWTAGTVVATGAYVLLSDRVNEKWQDYESDPSHPEDLYDSYVDANHIRQAWGGVTIAVGLWTTYQWVRFLF